MRIGFVIRSIDWKRLNSLFSLLVRYVFFMVEEGWGLKGEAHQ